MIAGFCTAYQVNIQFSIYLILQQKSAAMTRASDSNFLIRSFFLHCYIHITRILKSKEATEVFHAPRFTLFRKLHRKYKSGHNNLFKNILYTYRWEIIIGALVTCVFVFFNMLVPELIKMFLHYLHGHHTEKSEVRKAENFIQMLVAVQVLRVIFGEHTRRLFHQLAIKVQSSLARMLVVKSLNLTQRARKDIPHSEILQLQNVDLRLVWVMFNNMYFIFEAPLTITVALIMLFIEDKAYGFIGAYWFLIAFLLHRELDENMTHCNATKLSLIEQRSKVNYQILEGIKEAKLIGWEDVMIEKNNDFFQVENHDHELFYFFNCLYDIILLMLPILVVVTIGLWDIGEAKPIKVQQVYLMLSLLGLCYEPMKQFRTISISFHDGLHSLNRLQQYFQMPEQQPNDNIVEDLERGHLVIAKGTTAIYPNTVFDFFLKTNFQIELSPGDRLMIVSRKGQGRSSFINMINGFMKIIEGEVRLNGNIAYLSEDHFFLKSRVRDNIIFYNDSVSQEQIDRVADQLGLVNDLKKLGGLNAMMEDINIFTKSQLQRIMLARVLCSSADIYILDCPYESMDQEHEKVLEDLLREKQKKEGVVVIMSIAHMDYINMQDKVAIINRGVVSEYGEYKDLAFNQSSHIANFFKSKQELEERVSSFKNVSADEMKERLREVVKKKQAAANNKRGDCLSDLLGSPLSAKAPGSIDLTTALQNILRQKITELRQVKQQEQRIATKEYFKEFVLCVPIIEILFICLIICCAELLHVFIHFWIGHLEEEHGDNSYLQFQYMIIIEVILTLGLSGILYYQGEVSSQIAVMQGNSIYKQSLTNLLKKRISWFASEYSVKIADRFNHDYEEVFIACHSLLGIYKNVIILIVTVFFISSDGLTVLFIFSLVIAIYTSIFLIFRSVERKIVKHYYDYKYGFVKCFEESLEGADYFRVFGSKKKIVRRAENKYRNLAAYKQAERYTNHGLTIACDLTSNILLAAVVYYGMEMQIHDNRSNLALIATSIHLLMNGSQVVKNIVKDTISFETFFQINLVPFLEMNNSKFTKQTSEYKKIERNKRPMGYEVIFDNIVLKQPGEISAEIPLSFTIPEGEHVLIFERSDAFRNLILYAMTQNIGMIASPQWYNSHGKITIGGSDIRSIQSEYLTKSVGIILNKNFYISGTLRQNLVRKVYVKDEQLDEYVKQLHIDHDIEDYDLYGLDSQIHFERSKVNFELTRKFAIIRILLNKSKIVIIKDTPAFVGAINIIDILKKYIPNCTIIKISNKIETAFDVDRIISLENGVLLEQGSPNVLISIPTSTIGRKLKDANMEGYLFMNKISRAKLKKKGKKRFGLKSLLSNLGI